MAWVVPHDPADDTGPEPELLWTTVEHKIDAAMVLPFAYQDVPVGAYTITAELPAAVDRALTRRATAMAPTTAQTLKIA